jgi:hypothetical protein
MRNIIDVQQVVSAFLVILASRYLLEISTLRQDIHMVRVCIDVTWDFIRMNTALSHMHRRRARKLLRW